MVEITTKYINLFGGPGVGKSTTAAAIFVEMKRRGMNVELVTEVAKDFVWEGRMKTLDIQPYVTIKQFRNLYRLKDKVDYVVTDAPILLGCIYSDMFTPHFPASYKQLIVDLHRQELDPSVNVMLQRVFDYDSNGRYQNEDEAYQLDRDMQNVLDLNNIPSISWNPTDISGLVNILQKL